MIYKLRLEKYESQQIYQKLFCIDLLKTVPKQPMKGEC